MNDRFFIFAILTCLVVAVVSLIATFVIIRAHPEEQRAALWRSFWRGLFNSLGGFHE